MACKKVGDIPKWIVRQETNENEITFFYMFTCVYPDGEVMKK